MYRILLVEDEIEILKVVKEYLVKKGFDVVSAPTGRSAVDIIASGKAVDLVVLDVKMPQMTGFDCLKEIRKIKAGIPAIFVTGGIDRIRYIDTVKSLGCEIDDVLQKPVNLHELIDRIKSKLGG